MNINEVLEISQFKAEEVEKINNEIIISGEIINTKKICPTCGEESNKVNQYYTRMVRSLPIHGKQVYLRFTEKILKCNTCNKTFTEKVDFVERSQRFTRDYHNYIYELAKKQDFKRVAEMERIDPDTVKNFFKTYSKSN
jgi:transposase